MIAPMPFSADVTLTLLMNDKSYPLSKIGRDEIFFRSPVHIPPGLAEILMTVDGREHRWPVKLVHGAYPFDEAVQVRSVN